MNKPGAAIDGWRHRVVTGVLRLGILGAQPTSPPDANLIAHWSLKRSEFGLAPFTGRNCCQPIYSRTTSAGGETNWLQFAVPGGLIGGGTKIDPTLYRTDRLARQTFSAVGKLWQIFTEPETSLFVCSASNRRTRSRPTYRSWLYVDQLPRTEVRADLAKIHLTSPTWTEIGEKVYSSPCPFTFLRSCWAVQFRELGTCATWTVLNAD
ncbi:hypothetical protein EDB92DRAFT_1819635 [Lactarius akahatsu]|uniref:Uncharacterized protein n=1 Tax=Lactarius akahatsu TaxID=416441 RepID=A0AAD4L769_9AGAM|nr:hypothetical protein EDB92DRAFT_1819635 [Lactarius akahatsu]